MEAVLLSDVTAGPPGSPTVHELSLEVHQGETVVVPGLSRDAQDLVPRLTLGLERPRAGVIRVFGQDVHRVSPPELRAIRRRLSYVPAGGQMISNLTLFDNVVLPLRYHRLMEEQRLQHEARAALEEHGLGGCLSLRPHQLNPSQKRVASLVRGTLTQPDVVVLVDPYEGVDDRSARFVLALLEGLVHRCDAAVLITTHVHSLDRNYGGRLLELPNLRVLRGAA